MAADLAASALIGMWLVARANKPDCDLPFGRSEEWFRGGRERPLSEAAGERALAAAGELLARTPAGVELDELLPYICELLQPHAMWAGEGGLRRGRRLWGAVYTPSDVADFIVEGVLGDLPGVQRPSLLDPSCGTGVFLRSAVERLRQRGLSLEECLESISGVDIAPQAAQCAAFVLVSRLLRSCAPHRTPMALFEHARSRIMVADATRLASPGPDHQLGGAARTLEFSGRFDCVVGNPPYSRLPPDASALVRQRQFRTAPASGMGGPAYPVFAEMMWRFTRPERAAAGMVLPLAVAYRDDPVHRALRREMRATDGLWRLYFFDRSPDSLLGDDVKTRNCIALLSRGSSRKTFSIQTTSLVRWNAKTRSELFTALKPVDLGDYPILHGIPKLGSTEEADIFRSLPWQTPLGASWLPAAPEVPEDHRIYHLSTAYNWLPVFRYRPGPTRVGGLAVAQASAKTIACASGEMAWFTFAALSTRLAFWLWRVTSDGFHLTRQFLASLPVHPRLFTAQQLAHITEVARCLWAAMLRAPVIAVNAGVRTTSYSPLGSQELLDDLDAVVVAALALPAGAATLFKRSTVETIAAGRELVNVGGSIEAVTQAAIRSEGA